MQVFFKVLMGCRPHIPEHMPEGFKVLMEECWDTDASKRPPFDEILRRLQACNLLALLPLPSCSACGGHTCTLQT